MPTVAVDKADLYKALGREYTTEEFDELCFEFGIELDDDTTEEAAKTGDRPQLKIEIPANRYDMLCIEGIARALNVFLGRQQAPHFKLVDPSSNKNKQIKISVEAGTQEVRPFVAGAVLRGLTFTPRSYESFISVQEKLHANLCRNRSLVAIGTHDLDKIQGTHIRYRAMKPEEVKFAPLNQGGKEMTGVQLMEHYEKDRNIGKYLHLIRDSPVYPVFYDEGDNVLSLPPIINSDRTKITIDTKNVFFDLSGTDRTKIEVVVNQLVAMFSEYTQPEPFTIEQVEIVSDHNDATRTCPDISPRTMTAEVSYLNSCLGLNKTAEELCTLLNKMMLHAAPSKADSALIDVTIPITRSDILHQCDIMEDAGIAYGFNNLTKTFPDNSFTVAEPYPINKLTDIVRREISMMGGWAEAMTLTLCSHDENFKFLNRVDDKTQAVVLENPKTLEYQVVRTSLLPGLLKTIRENRKHSLPVKVFEVSDIVTKNEALERRAENHRRVACVYAGKTSGFEVVHGVLDRLMKMLRVEWLSTAQNKKGYWIEEISASSSTDKTYFPGRGAKVIYCPGENTKPITVGSLGVLHPEVMANFEIPYVGSSLELDLATFL